MTKILNPVRSLWTYEAFREKLVPSISMETYKLPSHPFEDYLRSGKTQAFCPIKRYSRESSAGRHQRSTQSRTIPLLAIPTTFCSKVYVSRCDSWAPSRRDMLRIPSQLGFKLSDLLLVPRRVDVLPSGNGVAEKSLISLPLHRLRIVVARRR